ncbi:MAG: DUF6671 family protein [Gemmatimonas sp.]|jgi:hypothetical protein|uniref:DUF6671 family protein n=1 Tax=Gemmatimonas sp. TaxID=1962908 RepID=UPI00391F2B46|nr:hypothetical protein [Gemmatimonadota bacterium]
MHPYHGTRVALATLHAKAQAIAPALQRHVGAIIEAVPVDTDALGTFSGERERTAPAPAVCVAKARLGMQAAGLPYGMASEGSFGPHPLIPFVPGGAEWLAFVDDARGLVLVEECLADATNFSHLELGGDAPDPALDAWLERVGFPAHAVLVRPAGVPAVDGAVPALVKGIVSPADLAHAVAGARRVSPRGVALVETDMRAHCNPTRMASIASLAERLARRLAACCPACRAPGWGRVATTPGLACGWCGTPTALVLEETWGCTCCRHREGHPRADGRRTADPGQCPSCNP